MQWQDKLGVAVLISMITTATITVTALAHEPCLIDIFWWLWR